MRIFAIMLAALLQLAQRDASAQTKSFAPANLGTEIQTNYILEGLNFSPYKEGQTPSDSCCRQVSEEQLRERMAIVAPYTKWIRTFSCRFGLEISGRVAHEMGLKAAIGAWLGSDSTVAGRMANEAEIDSLIKRANAGEVDLAIVGSEVLLRNDLSEAQLIAYINRVRQAIPAGIPVTTADVYGELLAHPNILAAVDLVFANYYPYWEGVRIDRAMAQLHCWHQLLVEAAGGKPVLVSESGWPSCGKTVGCATPSPENASFYFLNFVSWARANAVTYFYFSAFDESWKVKDEGPQGACWGVWDKNGNLKPDMQRVFAGDTLPANWNTGEIPGGEGTPTIELTCVPRYGSEEFLQGQVWHARPDDYKVALYIYIARLSNWWTKPTFAQPLTAINCDGSWKTPYATGGIDSLATILLAFLVPKNYFPPKAMGAGELPVALDSAALAWTALTRIPGANNWSLVKKGGLVEISHGNNSTFPQYAALHTRDSYFRMNYGQGSGWGTSTILMPSFWQNDSLYQGAPILTNFKHAGPDLVLNFVGSISSLRANGQIRLLPPQKDSLRAIVAMNVSGNVVLAQRPGEAFKPLMLSSMRVSDTQWDASSAFVDSQTFSLPASGWIIQPPISGKTFGLKGGTSRWKTNAPDVEVRLTVARPITGWVIASQDPNDDNIGFWAASDTVVRTWQYTLIAKKPDFNIAVADRQTFSPTAFALHQNYPNPFNPSTTIRYALPKSDLVTLKVYDLLGNEIASLVHEHKAAGEHETQWHPEGAPSGVYVYRLQAGEYVEMKKLVLVR